MKRMPNQNARGRDGERGAALVTALLVAMLMLAAGGALIATAGMTASNAVDATAEVQAYYAADAGIQAALNVIRRNKRATDNTTDATFHNIACAGTAACTNTGNNMSLWLPYDATLGQVKLSEAPLITYAVTVQDPSKAATDTLSATYNPRYLKVRSVGRGPKGATKVLEMMVDRFKFTYEAPAPLVLRESEDGTSHVSLSPGPGAPNLYSGTDVSNPSVTLPAVGVGQTLFGGTTDLAIGSSSMAGEVMTGGVMPVGTAAIPWPSVVSDAQTAAATVEGMREFATSTACPGNHHALSGFTFIEGDCTLGPQNSGSGFLVITGTLEVSGNFDFSGLIFVLGEGRVERSGGGGGTIQGGILAANFTGTGSGGFGRVVFQTSGGGNSKIRYNSLAIEEALSQFGPRALGVLEK
jgi:Tfp pilus assembly protein PilX